MTISDNIDLAAEARATADALLKRDWSSVTSDEAVHVLAALRFLRSQVEGRAHRGYSFTRECRQALAAARTQALLLHHDYVGPEHILLALIHEDRGTYLTRLGIDPLSIAPHISALVKAGRPKREPTDGDLTYTSRGKRVLELTMEESRKLDHEHVRAEHLLLGLIRNDQGIATQALVAARVTYGEARAAVAAYIQRSGDTS